MRTSTVPNGSRDVRGLPTRSGVETMSPRRVNHGGAVWSQQAGHELRQPQDGAEECTPDLDTFLKTGVLAREGEDARITGGTRSLMRRLLGLNVTTALRPDGLREKGSFPAGAPLATLGPNVGVKVGR